MWCCMCGFDSLCVCLKVRLWCVFAIYCIVLYGLCVLLLWCLCVVCLNVFVCLFVAHCVMLYGMSCAVLFVLLFLCLCGFCVIDGAMVYGALLLPVCARVDLKQTSVFVCSVWGSSCDFVWFVYCFCAALCLCVRGV